MYGWMYVRRGCHPLKGTACVCRDVPSSSHEYPPRAARRPHSFDAVLECEAPNSRIHTYTGTLHWSHPAPQPQSQQQQQERRRIPVDQANLLLRGSTLRNTKWALGLVVHTGYETKIVMNSRCVLD